MTFITYSNKSDLFRVISKMEYGSTKMGRGFSSGGKLALWAFYTWCGYFVWAMARYIWVMSRIPDAPVSGFESDLGSTAESG